MGKDAVSLDDLAAIVAALDDEHALSTVLQAQHINQTTWAKARENLCRRLHTDSDERAHFTRLYENAQDQLYRRVEPLEGDLEAWATFLGHVAREPNPTELLRSSGLTIGDLGRLSRRWATRFDTDEKLAAKALKLSRTAHTRRQPTIRVGDPAPLKA